MPTDDIPESDLPISAAAYTDYVRIVRNGHSLRALAIDLPIPQAAQAQITALQAGQSADMLGKETLALLTADLAHAADTLAVVTNDPTPANNGTYIKLGASGAGSWQQAADRVSMVESGLAGEVSDRKALIAAVAGSGGMELVDADGFIALKVAQDGSLLLSGISTDSVTADVLTLAEIVTPDAAGEDYAVVFQDVDGFIGMGLTPDGLLHASLVASTSEEANARAELAAVASPVAPGTTTMVMFYGQSNSVGWTATPALSTSQPFDNVMTSGGAFVDLAGTTEEKPWFAACNYATALRLKDDGGAPGDMVLWGGGAGIGGASVTALQSGSSGYTNLVNAVSAAHAIDAGTKVPAICWIHGETDTESLMTEATYLASVETLRASLQTSINGVTGETGQLHVLTTQNSYKVQLNNDIALAQLHVCQSNALYHLVTPTYRIPYRSDNVHFATPGVKLVGAYFGRAMKHLLNGKRPQWLNPVSATYSGQTVTVKFDVPVRPLRLDMTSLAVTVNSGFKVADAGGTKSIESVVAHGDTVVIRCSTALSGPVAVRYALDYLGSGLSITSGGSGNLRDSESETVNIDGTIYEMFNACPAFHLTAYNVEF